MLRSNFIATAAAVTTLSIMAAAASADVYATPFVPSQPGTPPVTAVAPTFDPNFVFSYVGDLNPSAPIGRRVTATGTEDVPVPPTFASTTATYRYAASSLFTVPTTGVYGAFSAQEFDGYLTLYAGTFDPANPLVGALASDDDFTTIGGAVPFRPAFPGGTSDSGFYNLNLTAGTQYSLVTQTFSSAPAFAVGAGEFTSYVLNETALGSPAIPAGPRVPSVPSYVINNTLPAVEITLNVPDSGTITSMNSVTLFDLFHTFAADIDATLSHNGVTIEISTDNGASADFAGDYTFVDGGAALPTSGVITPGFYGSEGLLSAFVGLDVGGDWVLTITDDAGGDNGTIAALGLDIDFTPVPEPTSLALLGLAGLGLRRRK